MKIIKTRIFIGGVTSVVAIGCVLAVIVGGAAGQSTKEQTHSIAKSVHIFGDTPGLDNLQVLSTVPSSVTQAVQRLALFDGSDPSAALKDVLLPHPGATVGSSVYAFKDDHGNPCIVSVGLTLFCNPDSGTSVPGINWSIGGGDPENPSKFIAVYSNDVSSVSLTVDGTDFPVSMNNNIAYAEFPAASKSAVFTVAYTDGRTNTITTDLSGRNT